MINNHVTLLSAHMHRLWYIWAQSSVAKDGLNKNRKLWKYSAGQIAYMERETKSRFHVDILPWGLKNEH